MDTSNLFLNSTAVACILQVSKRTLYNYRTERRLNCYIISRKNVLYRAEDVVNFIKENSYSSYMRDRAEKLIEQYLVKTYNQKGIDLE
ncbi:hypothetical protein M2459_003641 [Parabacteroides sp. PF5-5]|uniref:helix-turn-helix domain-containing protein n=1 Tax=unclassified Parabacteroides TaxID=2649774 RepID=UPI002475F92B|nr:MULTISPECIES: helix-turn-helix domain-containing protein [unclassified Parabacteroides]MDH6306701.1 hypothetical protein [Parabacteroides sp. PH5-39]MDH6316232.1 hypothetical protein [Parabacteroides sp. PF5-13]MDH6321447.1 hypothetical protein [Parabacteroides sp. PH5-13]MDH6325178.1 hypothetical protein [Parabacteroides sp. PH5-8]MDH6329064.1 hypothetical protein [Parabacteroides sp. PH5-41]